MTKKQMLISLLKLFFIYTKYLTLFLSKLMVQYMNKNASIKFY